MGRKVGRERQRLILSAREVARGVGYSEKRNAAVAESANRSKIQLEEPDEESQLSSSTPSDDGTWKTISGRAIVSSEKLLEKMDKSVSCRFCQGIVQVMENVATKHGLGSTWRIQCENESCPSHKTNSVFNSSEKSRAFEITGPQFLAFEQSVVDIRRLRSFLVSLAWRRSTKTPGRIIQKKSKERQNFCSRKNQTVLLVV